MAGERGRGGHTGQERVSQLRMGVLRGGGGWRRSDRAHGRRHESRADAGPLRSSPGKSSSYLSVSLLEKLTRRGRAEARNKHLFKRSRHSHDRKYLRVVNLVFGRAGRSLMYNVFSPPLAKTINPSGLTSDTPARFPLISGAIRSAAREEGRKKKRRNRRSSASIETEGCRLASARILPCFGNGGRHRRLNATPRASLRRRRSIPWLSARIP